MKKRQITSGIKILAILLLIFLVACNPSPSATPPTPQPPTVDLTGTWAVAFELEGFVGGPYTWVLIQEGSTIFIYEPNALDIPCGQNEMSRVSGNRWRTSISYNPSNCPLYAPLSGKLSLNVLASDTAFGGSLTFRVTSPSASAGTYQGRIAGAKL